MGGKFKFSHSAWGLVAVLLCEGLVVQLWPVGAAAWLVLLGAALGSLVALYVATEVIERVRNTPRMLLFLSAVVVEFIIFYAFEYWFLGIVSPASFPTLGGDMVSLLLHSTMVFVFNPLYLPATFVGRALLLINTLSALGLVLFVLQNIWQIRRAHVA